MASIATIDSLDSDGDTIRDVQEVLDGTSRLSQDTDRDGIADQLEPGVGTDPRRADTDQDGLDDGAEVHTFGSNPLNPDTDGDGFRDGLEGGEVSGTPQPGVNRVTTPTLLADAQGYDSDGDGAPDSVEVALGTDPNVEDTDVDGLSDGDEVQLGTNPLLLDTDRDGLSDNYETGDILHDATNPLNADSDGDGLTDGEERFLGTDPLRRDTDGDTLGDGDEFHTRGTNVLDVDTDHDGIRDDVDGDPTGEGYRIVVDEVRASPALLGLVDDPAAPDPELLAQHDVRGESSLAGLNPQPIPPAESIGDPLGLNPQPIPPEEYMLVSTSGELSVAEVVFGEGWRDGPGMTGDPAGDPLELNPQPIPPAESIGDPLGLNPQPIPPEEYMLVSTSEELSVAEVVFGEGWRDGPGMTGDLAGAVFAAEVDPEDPPPVQALDTVITAEEEPDPPVQALLGDDASSYALVVELAEPSAYAAVTDLGADLADDVLLGISDASSDDFWS